MRGPANHNKRGKTALRPFSLFPISRACGKLPRLRVLIHLCVPFPVIQRQQGAAQLRDGDRQPHAVHAQQGGENQKAGDDQPEGPHEGDDGGDFAISQRRKQGGGKDVQPGEQKAHGKDRESVAGQLPDHSAPAGEHRHHGVPGELREQKHRHGGSHREDHGGLVDLL